MSPRSKRGARAERAVQAARQQVTSASASPGHTTVDPGLQELQRCLLKALEEWASTMDFQITDLKLSFSSTGSTEHLDDGGQPLAYANFRGISGEIDWDLQAQYSQDHYLWVGFPALAYR